MDKGQHLRLVIVEGSTPTNRVIALAVDLTVHFAATRKAIALTRWTFAGKMMLYFLIEAA